MSSTQVGSIHYDLKLNTKEFDNSINSVKGKLQNVGSSLSNFGSQLTTKVTLPLAAMTGGLTASAAQLEKTAASFDVLVGEGTKARKLFADIKKFADTTPFEFPELAKATTTMLGYGVAAEDILDRLKRLGDAAAAAGGDLNGVVLAYSQMIGRGKVTGDNLRQLTENMVTLRAELSQVSGIPMNELDKAIEGGLITTEMLNQALDLATNQGGKFFGGTAKLAQTFSGRMSTLKDQLLEVGRNLLGVKVDPELGLTVKEGGVFDRLSKLIPKISEGAEKLATAFEKLTPKQQTLAVGSVGAVAALGPLLSILGGMVTNIGALLPLLANPKFLAFLAILAAIAGIIYIVYKNWDTLVRFFREKIVPMWQDFVIWAEPVVQVIDIIVAIIRDEMLPALEKMYDFMVSQFKPAWESIRSGFENFRIAIQPLMPILEYIGKVLLVSMAVTLGIVSALILVMVGTVMVFIGAISRLVGWLYQLLGWLWRVYSEGMQAFIRGMADIAYSIGVFIRQYYEGGKNLIMGFVRGIIDGFNVAVAAVRDGMARLRRLLPFSPAKDGPFSGKGWTLYSGQSLMQGFADGIKKNSQLPQLALNGALSGAQLQLNGMAGGNTSTTNNSVNINGDITLGDQSAVGAFFNKLTRNNELAQKGMALQ